MSTDTDEIIFGLPKRFRLERERLGLTQKQLADLLVTSSRTIISYENGDTPPKLDKLIMFAGKGADVGYILAGQFAAYEGYKCSVREAEPQTYHPARRAAEKIFTLALSDADADLLVSIAKRFAGASDDNSHGNC